MSKSNACIYCKSGSYGPSCPFSPHKVHVHASDPKKCIYCGSYSVGPGCPFNPHSKMHVHGIEYNQMVNDSVKDSIIVGYLMNKLEMPLTETPAYKLNLIDEKGNKIKKPQTVEEHAALSTLDQYIIDMKQTLGSKLDLINSSVYLNVEQTISLEEYSVIYEKELAVGRQIKNLINELKKITAESYQLGLNTPTIEKLILKAFEDDVA